MVDDNSVDKDLNKTPAGSASDGGILNAKNNKLFGAAPGNHSSQESQPTQFNFNKLHNSKNLTPENNSASNSISEVQSSPTADADSTRESLSTENDKNFATQYNESNDGNKALAALSNHNHKNQAPAPQNNNISNSSKPGDANFVNPLALVQNNRATPSDPTTNNLVGTKDNIENTVSSEEDGANNKSDKQIVANDSNTQKDNSDTDSLERNKALFASSTGGSELSDEDDYLSKQKRKSQRKKAAIAASGVLVVSGLVASIFVFNPFGSDSQNVGKSSSGVVTSSPKQVLPVTDGLGKENFWDQNGQMKLPVTLQSWQMNGYTSDKDLKGAYKYYAATVLGDSASRLPSASSGFTSDPNKMNLPNGTINPMYSTVLYEDYVAAAGSYVERFINPLYGGWRKYQYPAAHAGSQFNTAIFNDVFSDNFLQTHANANPRTYMPILADWQENSFGLGNQLLSEGPRWIGTIVSMTPNFVYSDSTGQYTNNLTVKVKYSAWTKDQNVLSKTGTLKLKLISNTTNKSKAKVLVDSASLALDK